MSIHHCDLGLLQWKPSKPGTWPTNLRDMTQIYSNYVMWPTKRELECFVTTMQNVNAKYIEICRNPKCLVLIIEEPLPQSSVSQNTKNFHVKSGDCHSAAPQVVPQSDSMWFFMIFMSISSVFPFPFIWFIFTFHVVFHQLFFFGSQLPGAHSSADRDRRDPSSQLPSALGSWQNHCRFSARNWNLGPRGSQKIPGIPGGIPGAGDAQNQGTSSCFIGNAWEIIELYVSFDTFFIESLSNSMDHLYYSYISFLKGALSKMNLCIGFREFGPTEGIEHPRATLHHQCMRMPQYAW